MTVDTHQVSRFGWLIEDFAARVPGVAHAVVISVDGLLLTASTRLPAGRATQMSAVAAGIVGLNKNMARCFGADQVVRVSVEMEHGSLLITSIRDGSCLAVLADRDCDITQVSYEMAVLVDQAGQMLTPQLLAALAAS
jgi:uncharacterized protein